MKKDFDTGASAYIEKIERRTAKTEIVEMFTPPQGDDIVIMGTYSRTWRNKPHREIMKGKRVEVEGRLDTPTAHTRDYVSFCYARRPAKREQREVLKKKRMPLYSYPCFIRDAVYLDIKSAWFSIVNLVGWDCEYMPGRWLGRGGSPFDFPLPNHKVARSAMVTIGRTTALPVWKGGKMIYQKMYNNTENYHIWGVISDSLNAIATVALECGARYINTDGFILPRKKAAPLMLAIEAWGLTARVKYEGLACVCGPGAYVIGDHSSLRQMQFTRIDCVDRGVDTEFLRSRVAKRAGA